MPVVQIPQSFAYKFWITTILLSVICFVVRASFGFEYFGDIVATAISALCIALTVASVLARSLYG
jgi:hypothetical protein